MAGLRASACSAIGIDASVTECQSAWRRLERNPDVEYVATFVSPRVDKPIDLSAGPAAPLIMKMRDRMSFMRTREIREERLRTASTEEQLRHNAWEMTGLADPAKPVVVPDLLAARGWTDLDYLKIDTDGIDWEILQILCRPAGAAAPAGRAARGEFRR